MFDTQIGLAAKWPNDPKVCLWASEAYTYFQKLTLTDAHLHVWDDLKLCLKFKAELEVIFHALPSDNPAKHAVSQMHNYFHERIRVVLAHLENEGH